jgi:hypothetical protein
MNVEIGTEAAQITEKEYINGIFLAMQCSTSWDAGKNLPERVYLFAIQQRFCKRFRNDFYSTIRELIITSPQRCYTNK